MNRIKIVFFIDDVNISFPGYSIIIRNLLEYIPNSFCTTNIDELNENNIVIPLGIAASHSLFKAGIPYKITFLCDSPTLTFKSIIEFNIRKRIFTRELFGAFLRLIKYSYLERKILRYSEKIIVVSDYDQSYLLRKYKCNHVFSIPNGVSHPKKIKPKLDPFKPTLGFLYYWGVQNSIDDIDWFMKSYVPIIKNKFPELEVIAAGKGANKKALKYFDDNNINYIGQIEDLNDFFSRIDVFITTVRKKCGILNKVLDAIAHKKIVMAFEDNMLAFVSLDQGYYSYKTVGEFIENLERIRTDSSENKKYINNSYEYTMKKHNWKTNYMRLYEHIKHSYDLV